MEELDLGKIRDEIDDIDRELVRLFEVRMDTVIKVAKFKEKNNQPVLDKSRESLVIDKAKSFLKDPHYDKPVEEFFENIMAISRRLQAQLIFSGGRDTVVEANVPSEKCKKVHAELSENTVNSKRSDLTVCFQGVPGAFSESALIEYFGADVERLNVVDFEDVFKSLKADRCDYGILPIENSSTGGVSEVCDLLRKYGLYIVGEESIKIDQNLLALKGTQISDIKEVYSHPQALSQSQEYLNSHKDWEIIPFRNTAESAKLISELKDPSKACVASSRAAEIYDLEVIAENINYNANNHTRFIVIGKDLEVDDESNKISIVFSAPHKPGALYSALSYFAENNLNMLRIESRPIIDKSWEYFFYIDLEGNIKDDRIKYVIDKIEKDSMYFKLLGNYKKTT